MSQRVSKCMVFPIPVLPACNSYSFPRYVIVCVGSDVSKIISDEKPSVLIYEWTSD